MIEKTCEGDVIRNIDNIFFDVKGLVHPPGRIIAFPRFIPDVDGDRELDGMVYRKIYPLSERYALLKKLYPQYLVYDSVFNEILCQISVQSILRLYKPTRRLSELRHKMAADATEKQALELVNLLKDNAKISWSKLGISGSILIKLHTLASDLDPIVYGFENCYRVHSALRAMHRNKKSPLKPYKREELWDLFSFRSRDTVVPLEDFLRSELRKTLQGRFRGRDYFIRFVKDLNEIGEKYGQTRYIPKGYARIKASVIDDSEAIFTPCRYAIDDVEPLDGRVDSIKEIVSFRGRFCEQARKGESVIAQGKVEQVQTDNKPDYCRLLLGNRTSDYMILA